MKLVLKSFTQTESKHSRHSKTKGNIFSKHTQLCHTTLHCKTICTLQNSKTDDVISIK